MYPIFSSGAAACGLFEAIGRRGFGGSERRVTEVWLGRRETWGRPIFQEMFEMGWWENWWKLDMANFEILNLIEQSWAVIHECPNCEGNDRWPWVVYILQVSAKWSWTIYCHQKSGTTGVKMLTRSHAAICGDLLQPCISARYCNTHPLACLKNDTLPENYWL